MTHVKQRAVPACRGTRIVLTHVNGRTAALSRLMSRRPQPQQDAVNASMHGDRNNRHVAHSLVDRSCHFYLAETRHLNLGPTS
ncbi:hypothetical protein, partial [Burkholderia seminalis]|uniref:hypothetical protein n=1 Tax=Burkholderia seminalis TaxID=488731 RepID=UPI001F2E969E